MAGDGGGAIPAAIAAVFRDEIAHVVGTLVRRVGDFALAEDAVQDAVLAALTAWQRDGIPSEPRAWLRTAAYNRAVDRLRREARGREKLAELAATDVAPARDTDDRLRLLFTCCHPAIAREAQVALTLRAVAGLTTPEIARAFLVPEPTMAQRITRAKRKIVAARIPWRIPEPAELDARVGEVLTVLYLVCNEGYLATGGASTRPELLDDAVWLTRLVGNLLPQHPEAMALLALMQLHRARDAARVDAQGRILLLQDQDRGRWDHARIAEASRLLEAARRLGRPGRFWIEAAIAACHCEAPSWEETTGRRCWRCTARWSGCPPARWSGSTAPWRCSTSPGRPPRSRRSSASPASSTATTSSTPPAPSSCAASAARRRRHRPTPAPCSSPPTRASGRCWPNA